MRLLALLCSLVLSISPFLPDNNNNALADIGLDARVVSKEERDRIVEAMELTRSTERYNTGNIQSLAMDSTEPEFFYVGFDDTIINGTYVECYTVAETYQYTISFKTYGSYEIFSSRGMLFLYLVRAGWVLAFDANGNVAEVYELNNDNLTFNDEVLERLCNQTKYESGGKIFEIGANSSVQHPFFAPYSYLKVTDQNGSSHYLYKTSESPPWTMIVIMIIWVIVVVLIIKNRNESKEDNDQSNSKN